MLSLHRLDNEEAHGGLPLSFKDRIALLLNATVVLLFLYLIASIAFHVWGWKQRRTVDLGCAAWNVCFLAILFFLAVWRSRKLIELTTPMTAYVVPIFIAGFVPFARTLFTRLEGSVGIAPKATGRTLLIAVMLVATSVLGFIALELPCNESIWYLPFSSVAFSLVVIAMAGLALFFTLQQNGIGFGLVAAACCFIGLAEHFVLTFKGAAILPSDVLAIGTALEVSDQYVYTLNDTCLQSIMLAAIALGLSSTIHGIRLLKRPRWYAKLAANLVLGAVCAGTLLGGFNAVKIGDLMQIAVDNWQPFNTYAQKGFIPTFLVQAQELAIPVPENYTDEGAREAEQNLINAYEANQGSSEARTAAEAQFANQKPTIIAIMNESFADLSIYNGLNTGYEGPTYAKSLPGALQSGVLNTSVLGGGTCNTEFEFLTGSSLAFIGPNKYPYMLYSFANAPALPRQLKELGYATTAIHPENPANFNRALNYAEMGFDQFLSRDDIVNDRDAEWLHSGVTDATTYRKILALLESSDDPQFIFDVTMQNHGGYDVIDVPADKLITAAASDLDSSLQYQINEYASCIVSSEQDLEQFIEQLKQVDRPVVLVFFGDHQPGFAGTLNDQLFTDEDGGLHFKRSHETLYTIWANYEIAGAASGVMTESSPSLLAAQILNMIGAPLTDYQKATLGASDDITAINQEGYLGSDGAWYALDDAKSAYAVTIDKWRRVQYFEFAENV